MFGICAESSVKKKKADVNCEKKGVAETLIKVKLVKCEICVDTLEAGLLTSLC